MTESPRSQTAHGEPSGELDRARYTAGGDEFLFVEISAEMSLEANFRVMAMARRLAERDLPGIIDICPANASLMIRFDPDVLPVKDLEPIVRGIEMAASAEREPILNTRIVEVPVWFDDPHTAGVVARFRKGYHQQPDGTDLDYAAAVNNLSGPQEFIERYHSQPWIVGMVGFVAGLPFLFQLVERDDQLVVPKYLSPRTDTLKLTLGHGGCFGAIYSVRGAGGYQMFGLVAPPIYDPTQRLADFTESSVFFRSGDIVKYRPIDEAEYNSIQTEVENGSYVWRQAPVQFSLEQALADPLAHNRTLMEALNV